jgi:hypothetical protein
MKWNNSGVARSIWEARRETADNLRLQVDAAARDPHDGEMPTLIAIADREQLRGLPAFSRRSGSSAIAGTEPGTDAHIERIDQSR